MEKIATLNKGENVLTVDCQKEKVYFNGNEVTKISMNFGGGVLFEDPYYFMDMVAFVEADNMQDYLDNIFEFHALVYRDKANKEHFVVDDGCEWRESGSGTGWDSIEGWFDCELEEYVVAYCINDGKRVYSIHMEKELIRNE